MDNHNPSLKKPFSSFPLIMPENKPAQVLYTTQGTYEVGSNMLDSMKHCVAMGGAATGAFGLVERVGMTVGVAAGGVGVNTAGAVPAWLRALAAYCGIWNPVPATEKSRHVSFSDWLFVVVELLHCSSRISAQPWRLDR